MLNKTVSTFVSALKLAIIKIAKTNVLTVLFNIFLLFYTICNSVNY